MARFLDETGLAYFWEKIKAFFQSHQQTIPEYTIEKKQTAEEGYISSYVLKKNGAQVGATINIPKDYLVRSGEVNTVMVADEPYEGAAVGDKYLDFVVNTVDDSGSNSHIYIPLSDLVDAYIAGNGIQINQSNYISVKINSVHANGLGVGGDGLSLYTVTPSSNGVGGTNGAMTATDKEKLDGLPTNAKALQTAVSDPTASGTSIEFVSNITQNENGEITPLKKTVRTMTASGQNHSSGLVPDPGSTAGSTRYLCENGTWSEPNGGGGGTSTPIDVQINGTSITSNNVANVQTEGVYNAVKNKIATMSDLPSTSGLALDSAVVHKTGDETVGGTKTFNSNVVLGANANLALSTAQDEGVYIEANTSSGGQQALTFANLDDDSAVRLENVASPSANTDAANKQYVDDAVGNTYVSLNGAVDTYGIQPYSLCAFAFTAMPTTMAMTSFTTSGGTGSKTPITDRWFQNGCKIYYHDSGTACTNSFTSKRFYSTYNGVDARYSAVTGTNVSLSSGKAVYLMVEVNSNGLWKPFYNSGETNEIIVTDTLSDGHFYIYLGRVVGSTGHVFQLEDNNPLYACVMDGSGTHLVDWASYNSDNLSAGNGIEINQSNYISVKINSVHANGLGVGGDGLSLYTVTPSSNGVGGTNGAMTATDKEKLDGLPTNAKALQTAVSDPTASGTSIEFVSNITQNENGEITPLKKTVRTMTASGQNHSSGLVPDPGSTAGSTRYLCENGTWSEPNGGGGGTSTPIDVQINGTSITSNNVANVQTEGVYNAVKNKIATMSDLPSTSGLALDSAVVHKTGDETVGGTKTFNSNVVLGANANLALSTAQDEGVYIEANTSSGGQQALTFANLDDDSAVRLENVASPSANTDAANKQYVDDAVGNTYVSLNGAVDTYGIQPYSLCAFAFTAMPTTMAMTSFTTSGGTGSKTPITDRWFQNGCKIYYHDSGTACTNSFTSKRFYSTYNGVDARYSAVTGTNVSLSSGKAVYLMVEVNSNGLWKPFYNSGETNEIIVTDTLSDGHFYIYLGRVVGSTGHVFQLEDNNPLYACVMDGSGTHLVDWASYNSDNLSAGNGIEIEDGLISHKGWFYKQNLTQDAQINNSAQCDFEFNTLAKTPPKGVYLITGQALINNPNSKENQAHVVLRYRLTSNGNYTVISATSVTLAKAMQSTDGGTYGATSVFLQGIIALDTKPSYLGVEMLVEVETDGNYSYLTTTAPLSGSLVETLTEGATNIVMCRIGDCQNV